MRESTKSSDLFPSGKAHPVTSGLIYEHQHIEGPALDARGAALAGGLRRLGLAENDAVAVLLRNGPVWADVILACRIGGTYYAALNWHLTPPEIAFILWDSGARALIAEADLLPMLREVIPPGMTVLAVGGGAEEEEYEG